MLSRIAIAFAASILFCGAASAQTIDRAPPPPDRLGIERRPLDLSENVPAPQIRLLEKQVVRDVQGTKVRTYAIYWFEIVNRQDYAPALFQLMANGRRRTLLWIYDGNAMTGFYSPEAQERLARFPVMLTLESGAQPRPVHLEMTDHLFNVTARSNTVDVR